MSVFKIFLPVFTVISILFTGLISAQEVNYSGNWKLDKAKSTLQGWMAENLLSLSMKIRHENKNLRIVYDHNYTNGSSVDTLQVLIGGEAVSGKSWNGRIDYTTRARMGDKKTNLILETESTYWGQNGTFTTNYTETVHLTEDKKALIIDRITKTDFDTSTSELVFKQADVGMTK